MIVYITEEKKKKNSDSVHKKLWHVKQRQFEEWDSHRVTVRHVNIVAVIPAGEEN